MQETKPRQQQPAPTRRIKRQRGVDIVETIGLAWASLLSNKLRAMLTMLGVIIGIGAVITMVTIGRGAQAQTEKQLKSLGSNLISVQSGTANFGSAASQGAGSATKWVGQIKNSILIV